MISIHNSEVAKTDYKLVKRGIVIGIIFSFTIIFFVLSIMVKSGNILLKSNKSIIDRATILKIDEIMQLIDNEYFGNYDKNKIHEKIIKSIVEGLDDEYSAYYNTDESLDLLNRTSGQFSGIGVVIQHNKDNSVVISDIYRNGPAYKSGLKIGDIIKKINGNVIDNDNVLLDVVKLIKGSIGTDVKITVIRNGKSVDYIVTRDIIQVKTVTGKIIDDIGYIAISMFSDTAPKQFKSVLNNFLNANVKGIIIDLRDNPGGTIASCKEMLENLLPRGVILNIKDKYGNKEEIKTNKNCLINIPIAVLINKNSASASEIFAGAMQDRKSAIIIGSKSYGNGVMQKMIKLSDESYVKLTTYEYFTPNGNKINNIGIKPDFKVDDEDLTLNIDNSLKKAIEILKFKR